MATASVYTSIASTISEGPGKRYAIWFQGCLKRCKGCCNEELLRIDNSKAIPVSNILEEIKKSKEENGIEGITFLGGEPILQIYAVLDIARYCKSLGLSTMLFSGYYKSQIEQIFPKESKELFELLDILIDGPFEINNLDKRRRWIGSTNQNVYFFTDRYNKDVFLKNNKQSVEIRTKDREIIVNGWPV